MFEKSHPEDDLFEEALRKAAGAERVAFLDGACRDNHELRARMELMIDGHLNADGFLPTLQERMPSSPGTLTERARLELVGSSIGPYTLLEKIGEGGCGVVYIGEQEKPVRRRVALKVIKLGMDTRSVIGRFEAERQALEMMDHPNIARVLDAGTTDAGRPYFVMDLVKGIRITDYCDQNNLTTGDRLELFAQVCHAIQHAHQKGIIHRDIKPSNVLVTTHDGVPMPTVIDFGIAKATQGPLTEVTIFTELNQFIGTPAYMSPEQAEKGGLDLDTRTDIYALGVLLYELLTGTTPFDGQELFASGLDAMRRTICGKEPARPSTRLSTMPEAERSTLAKHRQADPKQLTGRLRGDLDWIVMKCLEKDKTRRYETPSGLAADLKRHLNNQPIIARPASAAYRFQKTVRRNKLVFVAATAVAVALLAGIGVSTWQLVAARRAQNGEQQQRLKAESLQKIAETEWARAEQEAEARRLQLYAADVNLAGESLDGGNSNFARELLARQIPALGETDDLRGFEWRHLWRQSQSAEQATLGEQNTTVHGVRFSPDGTLLASSEVNGTVKLWDSRTYKHMATLCDTTVRAGGGWELAAKALAFSPDGAHLAVGVGQAIVLWEVASHQRIAVLNGHSQRVNYLVFAHGGKILASGADDGLVKVWDVTSTEPRELAALNVGLEVSCLAVSYDGKILAASSYSAPIKRWELSNVEAPVELPPLEARPGQDGHFSWVLAIAFSPKTNLLISAGSGGEMIAWELASEPKMFSPRKLALPHGSIGIVHAVAFTPDGQTMLSAGSDNNITLWDLSGREQPLRLMGHRWGVYSIDVSPDGRTLVSGGDDRTVRLWDVSSRWRQKPKMSHGEWMYAVAISPDSKFIASISSKLLKVWDAASEKLLSEHATLQGKAGHLDFSPDSKILVAEDDRAGTIRLLKAPEFVTITSFRGSHPQFSPDGRLVYVRSDGRIGIHWRDLRTQEEQVWKTPWNSIQCLTISPDGRRIATVADFESIVWILDAAAPDHPVRMETHTVDEKVTSQNILNVAFSPDGHWLASASWDGRVRLWNLENPQEKIQPLKAHSGAAWAVAFSHDSCTLATGGDDATIKLWNLASLQQTATLRGHTGPVDGLAFSRDGTLLGSSSGDRTVRLWRAPKLEEIERAEKESPH